MKKIINSRINGYALLAFFVGMFANYMFKEWTLIVAAPLLICWILNHEERSYKHKFRRDNNE